MNQKSIADVFIDRRGILLAFVGITSVFLALSVAGLKTAPSFDTMWDTDSEEYLNYSRLGEMFGHEEFIVVAVRNNSGASDAQLIAALRSMTKELEGLPQVETVRSLTNLRFFQEKGGRFGAYPVMRTEGGVPNLPDSSELERIRKAFPPLDLLLSADRKTWGVLVAVPGQWKLDPESTRQILLSIDSIVKKYSPAGSDHRIVGPAVLRLAIHKYSLDTAVVFGLMCALICAVVTVYVLRSLRVTLMATLILGLCVLWVLGLMSVLRIPLNPTTSISFGLILITTLEIVIHMVVRYHQFRALTDDRVQAVRTTVRFLARPFLFCSATTAVGFGTCMVSSIPMVFQLGLIMPLGLLISYGLAMLLIPAILIAFQSMNTGTEPSRIPGDFLSPAIEIMRASIAKHHRLYCFIGFGVCAVMFAGTPLIRTDPQLLRHLRESNPEVQDIRFVEKNLTSVHSLDLILEAEPGAFKETDAWKKIAEIEKRLNDIPEVIATTSLLSYLQYMQSIIKPENPASDGLFTKPGMIPELLFITSMSEGGKEFVRRYLTEDFGSLRMSVRIRNSPATTIVETIDSVSLACRSVAKNSARCTVTGELAVYAALGAELVRSTIHSIFLALVIITVLMMIQMGTPSFGLISIVPNIPPLATVFGVMGWFGISLNSVSIFAAAVAVGLAVDNTIQYVTQLKREIRLNPDVDPRECILRAYSLAAKPIATWSTVTLLGFLALWATPFQGAVNFGILVASAVFMGMFGDLIFMQSIMLTFPGAIRLLSKAMEKERSSIKVHQA